jgi:cbb3-type cytochrome oxidase maturation protein
MSMLYVLIPLGLALLAVAIWAFFWAVESGQFDDLETPGTLVLFDEEPPAASAHAASVRGVLPGAAPTPLAGAPR